MAVAIPTSTVLSRRADGHRRQSWSSNILGRSKSRPSGLRDTRPLSERTYRIDSSICLLGDDPLEGSCWRVPSSLTQNASLVHTAVVPCSSAPVTHKKRLRPQTRTKTSERGELGGARGSTPNRKRSTRDDQVHRHKAPALVLPKHFYPMKAIHEVEEEGKLSNLGEMPNKHQTSSRRGKSILVFPAVSRLSSPLEEQPYECKRVDAACYAASRAFCRREQESEESKALRAIEPKKLPKKRVDQLREPNTASPAKSWHLTTLEVITDKHKAPNLISKQEEEKKVKVVSKGAMESRTEKTQHRWSIIRSVSIVVVAAATLIFRDMMFRVLSGLILSFFVVCCFSSFPQSRIEARSLHVAHVGFGARLVAWKVLKSSSELQPDDSLMACKSMGRTEELSVFKLDN